MVFNNFTEFYPAYLEAHSNIQCRRMHFIWTSCAIATLLLFFFTGAPALLVVLPLVGYGFAWSGHLLYEKSAPMTFKYPLYSLLGDFKMFWDILRGEVRAF